MLKLGRGVRIQFEKSTRSNILLFPEGIVDINESAHAILSRLPMGKKELEDELCKITNTSPPLKGFDEFIKSAINQGWIR